MIIYIDMDDVLCDYSKAFASVTVSDLDVAFPQSLPGFFEKLEPIEGAIESVEILCQQHDVFILTAPSTRNPLCYTEKRIWVEQQFGYEFTKRLILSPDKGLLKGDYLIDDHVEGRGQDRFGGKLIHFGSEQFPNWDAVIAFFEETGNDLPRSQPM